MTLNNINHKIVLFDGVCNFCNYWVNFIIKHDHQNIFKFASLQSDTGKLLLKNSNLSTDNFDSFVLLINNNTFLKSTAAFKIAGELGGIFKIILIFRLLPKAITDFFYDLIAKNRDKIFGIKNQCMVPDKSIRDRFLS